MTIIKRFIFFIFLSIALNATGIKNIYIFIEPTTIPNRVDSKKNKEINDVLRESIRVAEDIIKVAKKNHIKNIYLSRVWKKYRHQDPVKLKKDINFKVLKKKLKPLKKYHKYNIAKILGSIHNDFEALINPKETIFLYIGDVNYMNSSIDSTNGYLNSAWLTNKSSIFVKKFLNQDNSALKDMPIFIINRLQLPLPYEKRKEDFIVKLFELAGMKPVFIGVNPRIISPKIQQNYIVKSFENRLHNLNPIKSNLKTNSTICQIITPNSAEVPIPNCGGQ